MSFDSDTTIRRQRASALRRRRPNNSAGRGFLYRRQRNDEIPGGGSLPILPDDDPEPITITQVRTLPTILPTSTTRTTSTTSRATTTTRSSVAPSSSESSSSSSLSVSEAPTTITVSTPSATVITSPTPSGSNAGSNSPDSSVQSSSGGGLSSGAIAGIAITVVVVLAALIAYLVRRRMIASRAERKGEWYDRGGFAAPPPPVMAQATFNATPPSSAYVFGSEAVGTATATPLYSQPPPPPPPPSIPFAASERPLSLIPGRRGSDYSSSAVPFQAQPSTVPIPMPVAAPLPAASTPPGLRNKTVRCTFVPSMEDELSISTGETVRVLQEYDDGWALCLNQQGTQGMVPLECLDEGAPSGWLEGDKKGLKRASSLSENSKAV
ncbi:hypothetical protein PM082_004923 [Marasmius tenuissimus]|nr:hypothetical protein PM082_004923 [Marasmius tenuissimus]